MTDDLDETFLAEAAAGRLSFQRCGACGHLRWPAGALCPECWSPSFAWEAVEHGGSVWSFGVYDRAFDPAFEDKVPYVVALVELDAGPRLIGNVVGVAPEDVIVGMRVAAVFDDGLVQFGRAP
ncbi:MAG: OB-fold domain-containing protein [Actinomycetota bacterium]